VQDKLVPPETLARATDALPEVRGKAAEVDSVMFTLPTNISGIAEFNYRVTSIPSRVIDDATLEQTADVVVTGNSMPTDAFFNVSRLMLTVSGASGIMTGNLSTASHSALVSTVSVPGGSGRLLTLTHMFSLADASSVADIVFSSLGPGNTYAVGGTHLLSRFGAGFLETAVPFTPFATRPLRQIDVAINHINGTNSVMLSVAGSGPCASGGGTCSDGKPLENLTLTDLPGRDNTVIQPSQTVESTTHPELFKGTECWLVASQLSSDPSVFAYSFWRNNNIGEGGPVATNSGSGFSSIFQDAPHFPAFAVLGVPEPATLGLMVLGLLGAGFAGRKRRN
jgi:hypothetical protein